MGRKMEEFVPITPGFAGMYTCGPTVYNYAHIGNLRTYIFEDVLKRMLVHFGYKVRHVMNITDVGHLTGDGDDGEDKLGKMARETGRSAWDIAKFYTDAFFKDYDCLGIIRPDVICPATQHIKDMIGLIQRLEAGGHTYIAGGNVYFSIDTFPEYGKLANLDLCALQSGARIDIDSNKRNPKDFVLWFTNSKFGKQEMMWDSPWGFGYPGWHIECSAMSMKYLGEQFDIHCGGIDAIPVHHTNEIAQSEAATGKIWVKYWLHGEFLLSGSKGKMSKSSGEFLTLPLLVSKGYDPLDYRFFCLGAHYRSQLQFTYQAMDSARSARKTLNEKVANLKKAAGSAALPAADATTSRWLADFDENISNDMNMPKAMADLWGLLKDDRESDLAKLAGVLYMDQVLGLQLDKVKSLEDDDTEVPPEALELLNLRMEAKKAKDWAQADLARTKLEELGFIVKDTPQGTKLLKKM